MIVLNRLVDIVDGFDPSYCQSARPRSSDLEHDRQLVGNRTVRDRRPVAQAFPSVIEMIAKGRVEGKHTVSDLHTYGFLGFCRGHDHDKMHCIKITQDNRVYRGAASI